MRAAGCINPGSSLMLLYDEQKGNSKGGDREVLYTIPRSICSTRQCHKQDCVSHEDIDSAPHQRGCVDRMRDVGVALQHPLPTVYLLTSRRLERQVPCSVCRKKIPQHFDMQRPQPKWHHSGGRNLIRLVWSAILERSSVWHIQLFTHDMYVSKCRSQP